MQNNYNVFVHIVDFSLQHFRGGHNANTFEF